MREIKTIILNENDLKALFSEKYGCKPDNMQIRVNCDIVTVDPYAKINILNVELHINEGEMSDESVQLENPTSRPVHHSYCDC